MDKRMSNVRRPRSYAFFDVDDTLISVKSMFGFQEFWFEQHPDKVAQERFYRDMEKRHEKDISWEYLNRLYYAHFEGRNVKDVETCGEQWFAHEEKMNKNLYHQNIVDVLRKHQANGVEPVFVSGSFPAVLNPCAKRLGVETVLAIKMEVEHGHYTGNILAPQTIGLGKAEAVNAFLEDKCVSASRCFAYGDDISDLPMLQSVGYPHVISGGRSLERQTRSFGWPVLAPN